MAAEEETIRITRKAKIKEITAKLEELENTLNKFDTERSIKVQAWKKRTNDLIAS